MWTDENSEEPCAWHCLHTGMQVLYEMLYKDAYHLLSFMALIRDSMQESGSERTNFSFGLMY